MHHAKMYRWMHHAKCIGDILDIGSYSGSMCGSLGEILT